VSKRFFIRKTCLFQFSNPRFIKLIFMKCQFIFPKFTFFFDIHIFIKVESYFHFAF